MDFVGSFYVKISIFFQSEIMSVPQCLGVFSLSNKNHPYPASRRSATWSATTSKHLFGKKSTAAFHGHGEHAENLWKSRSSSQKPTVFCPKKLGNLLLSDKPWRFLGKWSAVVDDFKCCPKDKGSDWHADIMLNSCWHIDRSLAEPAAMTCWKRESASVARCFTVATHLRCIPLYPFPFQPGNLLPTFQGHPVAPSGLELHGLQII